MGGKKRGEKQTHLGQQSLKSEFIHCLFDVFRSKMRVDHSGFNILMAHEFLDSWKVNSGHHKMACECMAECMEIDIFYTKPITNVDQVSPQVPHLGTALGCKDPVASLFEFAEDVNKLILCRYCS